MYACIWGIVQCDHAEEACKRNARPYRATHQRSMPSIPPTQRPPPNAARIARQARCPTNAITHARQCIPMAANPSEKIGCDQDTNVTLPCSTIAWRERSEQHIAMRYQQTKRRRTCCATYIVTPRSLLEHVERPFYGMQSRGLHFHPKVGGT